MNTCDDCGVALKKANSTRCYKCYWISMRGKKQPQSMIENRAAKMTGTKSANYKHGKHSKLNKPVCIDCGVPIAQLSTRCKTCAYKFGWNKKYTGEYTRDFNWRLKKLIRKRDNYTCQECGKHESENKRKLDVHHIDYNKQNSSVTNLIALCLNCHALTNGNRKFWTAYFTNKLKKGNKNG